MTRIPSDTVTPRHGNPLATPELRNHFSGPTVAGRLRHD